MEPKYKNLNAQDVAELALQIQKLIVTELPQPEDDEDERNYLFVDPETERDFRVTRDEGFVGDADIPQTRFLLSEFQPNGRMVEGGDGAPRRFWDEPRFAEFLERYGPNGVRIALREIGADPDKMVSSGGGYGVGTIFLDSLEACAQAIAQALADNEWYQSWRPLTPQQKVKLDRQSAVQSHDYWRSERAAMDRALASEKGIFKGCFTMFGPVRDDFKTAILSYLNKPSQDAWNEIRSYVVTGAGTLWSAWCENDAGAPRAGNVGYPSKDALTDAVRAAVQKRSDEIDARLKETAPSGLRSV
jgi:hypothetical protein